MAMPQILMNFTPRVKAARPIIDCCVFACAALKSYVSVSLHPGGWPRGAQGRPPIFVSIRTNVFNKHTIKDSYIWKHKVA